MKDRMIHILLVEDDEVDVMNVKRAFKKNNITNPLYIANDGIEALLMLRGSDREPSPIPRSRRLILLDLNMPKMNGIEFLQELRGDENLKQIPVVMLTTSNEDKDKVEAYNLNVAGYILKPVTFDRFLQVTVTQKSFHLLC